MPSFVMQNMRLGRPRQKGASQTGNPGLQHQHVILWMRYSCSVVFCMKRGAQPHLSAANSSLAPIDEAPWTGIDNEIMSSCCLVNAILYFTSAATHLSFCLHACRCDEILSKQNT